MKPRVAHSTQTKTVHLIMSAKEGDVKVGPEEFEELEFLQFDTEEETLHAAYAWAFFLNYEEDE